jgi:hypothetical protein
MQFQLLFSFSLFTVCHGAVSNGGFCSNPSYTAALTLLDTCWLREQSNSYSLQSRLNTENPNTHGQTGAKNLTRAAPNTPPPYPWTHHPICNSVNDAAETTFCVYTSTSFASGRGISIVGTPQSVELISRNRVFHTPPTSTDMKSYPPYVVQQLPGRGYGLLANTTLHVGDQVLAHTPVLAMQAILDDHLSKGELRSLFHVAVKQLPLRTREIFMALQGDSGGDEMYGRFTTNAFELYG